MSCEQRGSFRSDGPGSCRRSPGVIHLKRDSSQALAARCAMDPGLPRSSRAQGAVSRLGDRNFVDAVFFRAQTGVQWRDLPERFGPWKTVYKKFAMWSHRGYCLSGTMPMTARCSAPPHFQLGPAGEVIAQEQSFASFERCVRFRRRRARSVRTASGVDVPVGCQVRPDEPPPNDAPNSRSADWRVSR